MDAIFPALIGLGLWFCYEAWTNPTPHPVAKVKNALGSGSSSSGPGPTGGTLTPNPVTGVVGGVYVNPNTGVAITPGEPVRAG